MDRLAREYCEARTRVARTAMGSGPPSNLCYDLRMAAFELAEHYVSAPEG
jgi:hypothetical protein